MDDLIDLRELLSQTEKTSSASLFFKTGPGDYAEHDQFIGISVPNLRKIAKRYALLSMPFIQTLIESPFNEERLLALFILIDQYQKGELRVKQQLYQFYLDNLTHINNWNLVDASAHLIIGAHLFNKDKEILLTLAESTVLWDRRVAIVSTWYFIRHRDYEWTIKLAEVLLSDQHDLIQKAVGWMLREAGKKEQAVLIDFLLRHASRMPRTMLRYAIEKLTAEERNYYLSLRRAAVI